MLGRLGLLNWDKALASLTRAAAFLIWLGSIALGGWLVWTMARPSSKFKVQSSK
jgi:hypothetical protein